MLAFFYYHLIVVISPAFILKVVSFVARGTTRLKYRRGVAFSAGCSAMVNTITAFFNTWLRVGEIELSR